MPGSEPQSYISIFHPCMYFSLGARGGKVGTTDKYVQRTRNFFDHRKGYEGFRVASLSGALKDFLSLSRALLYRLNLLSISNFVREKKAGISGGVISPGSFLTLVRCTYNSGGSRWGS